jgi:hypothetical protein
MKNLFPLLVLGLSASAIVSCGVSPILHHESPNREPQGEADPQNQDSSDSSGPRVSCDFSFPSQGLCASLAWVKKPTAEEPGEFLLSFWDKNQNSGQPLVFSNPDAHKVFVKLWMPDMGHGSSPVTTNQAVESNGSPKTGVFRSTGVFFIMGGKWEIVVQLKDSSGAVKESAKMIYQANY